MANSQRDTGIEREAARQSHYIEQARIIGILDPCGSNVGYQRIAKIYFKFLQSGVNYYNRDNLCSKTMLRYAKAINMLLILRAFRPTVDLSNKNNMAAILINNVIKEKNIVT